MIVFTFGFNGPAEQAAYGAAAGPKFPDFKTLVTGAARRALQC